MKLVEKGKIGLDNPVIHHLKSWEFPETDVGAERVTIRHLLSHSSGLPLGTIGLEYAPGDDKLSLRESLTREVQLYRSPESHSSTQMLGSIFLNYLLRM
jgi:CubicO group peptidase (beta-lactamase class C family)